MWVWCSILQLDVYVRPLYEKTFKQGRRKRIIDFNQGIEGKLVTDDKMDKLAETNIYPLRIAFDHWGLEKIYSKAIRTAVKSGIKNLYTSISQNNKLNITQEELAVILGISRVIITRGLSKLRSDNIIFTHRRWIEIVDPVALA